MRYRGYWDIRYQSLKHFEWTKEPIGSKLTIFPVFDPWTTQQGWVLQLSRDPPPLLTFSYMNEARRCTYNLRMMTSWGCEWGDRRWFGIWALRDTFMAIFTGSLPHLFYRILLATARHITLQSSIRTRYLIPRFPIFQLLMFLVLASMCWKSYGETLMWLVAVEVSC